MGRERVGREFELGKGSGRRAETGRTMGEWRDSPRENEGIYLRPNLLYKGINVGILCSLIFLFASGRGRSATASTQETGGVLLFLLRGLQNLDDGVNQHHNFLRACSGNSLGESQVLLSGSHHV